MRLCHYKWVTPLVALLLLYPYSGAAGRLDEAEEYQAKAALLYNFAKLVTWPEDSFGAADAPFVFAILGQNPFGHALKLIQGKSMHGRPIEIRHYPTITDFKPCQVLFCSPKDLRQLKAQYPEQLRAGHVLTVGQQDPFAHNGGILYLTFVENHLAFIINLGAARRTGLDISASLLSLALDVIETDEN